MLVKLTNYGNGLVIHLNSKMVMDVCEDQEVDATTITMDNGDTYRVKERLAVVVEAVNKAAK